MLRDLAHAFIVFQVFIVLPPSQGGLGWVLELRGEVELQMLEVLLCHAQHISAIGQ